MFAKLSPVFATAALALTATAAQAQDCPSEPVFVGVTAPNSDGRASQSRIERGDWMVARHFATEALESGTSSRNKGAAQINLCAALANLSEADAAEACDLAVAMNEDRWEAYTNRGAALWLAGDAAAASEDFARAAELGAGEDQIAVNSALAACAG
ncbi:MAG: hypothetical protein ACOC05_04325 [Oceanicaulis sp.]